MEVFYGKNILLLIPFLLLSLVQIVWLYTPRYSKQDLLTGHSIDCLVCLCVAVTVGTLLRQYPWTTLPIQTDSSVFLYIGKQMHAGKVPYVDLFDHKGPALYFLQYLGYAIWPGSRSGGIWVLEVVSLFFTSLVAVKISGFVTNDRRNSYLTLILLLIVCGFKLYQGGNYTEEHALLWITLSAYIFYVFFKNQNYTRKQIVCLGFSCMMVLLLQGNLVTVWLAFVPVVLLQFAKEKRFADIGRCVLFFCLGMIIPLVPVLIWAIKEQCLKEMWDYYILFNFLYTEKMAPGVLGYIDLTKKTLIRLWPGILAMIVSLIKNHRKQIHWLNFGFFCVSVVLMQMSGRDSLYYLLVILPALIIPVTSFFDAIQSFLLKNRARPSNQWIVVTTCLLMMITAIGHREISNHQERYDDGVVPFMIEETDEDDDVLIVGNYAWPYLAADRKTENKYFFQWPPIKLSDSLYEDFLTELETHPSDVIIFPEKENEVLQIPNDEKFDHIFEMLEQKGYKHTQFDGFSVWISK